MSKKSLRNILRGLGVMAALAFGPPSPAAAQACDGSGDGTWNGWQS